MSIKGFACSLLVLGFGMVLTACSGLNARVDQLEAENNAQQAEIDALNDQFMELEICPPGAPTRFIDNGDGTICDHETGLMWEKKNLTPFGYTPTSLLNSYSWTAAGDDFNTPTGTVFTDFLARLNLGRLAGYSDWRISTEVETQTLFSEPDPLGLNCVGDLTGQSSTEPIVCTHPVFGQDRGTWVVENMIRTAEGVPRNYWQFQWPDNQQRAYVPHPTPVRAVRGSMR